MLAFVHFVVLTALPLFVGFAVRRFWSRPDTARMIAATAVGGVAGVIGTMQFHACYEGVPLAQWIIPGASGTAAMLFVGVRPLRRMLAIASILAAFALSFSFTSAVHGAVYTGNPNPTHDRGAAKSEWHSFLTGLYAKP